MGRPKGGPIKRNRRYHRRGHSGASSAYFSSHRHCPVTGANHGGGKAPDLYDNFAGGKAKARLEAQALKAAKKFASDQAVAEATTMAERERKRQRQLDVARKLSEGYRQCRFFNECGGLVSPGAGDRYCDTAGHYNPRN